MDRDDVIEMLDNIVSKARQESFEYSDVYMGDIEVVPLKELRRIVACLKKELH